MSDTAPRFIHCTGCTMEWEVPPEDPDSTINDAELHVDLRHPGYLEWSLFIKEGRA